MQMMLFASLDIFPNFLHLDCFSNEFCSVLSEEQCNHYEVSLHLGRFLMDPEVCRRLLVELRHSLFLPEFIHSPKEIGNSTKFP